MKTTRPSATPRFDTDEPIPATDLADMREAGILAPSATPEPYAHEWHITVKADEHAGAIDALFNCIRSFQSGAEPIGGTCPRSMGNRMTYDVEKGRDTRDLEIAALQQAGRDAIATMQQDQNSIRDLLAEVERLRTASKSSSTQ